MNTQPGATEFLAAFSDHLQGQRQLRLDFSLDDGPQSMMSANSLVADEAMSREVTFTVRHQWSEDGTTTTPAAW